MDQQSQLGHIQAKEPMVDADRKFAGPCAVLRIVVVILSAAVVQERKGLDDSRVGAGACRELEAIESDARPVRSAVNSAPLQGEVCAQETQEFRAIHEAGQIIVPVIA